jgi:hypothetical protein
VAKAVRELDERGEQAISAAAELLNLPPERVRLALRYYGAYPDEIDAEMATADEESRAAEEAWQAEQRLLA